MTPSQRFSDFRNPSSNASSLLRNLQSYMPALTPVIARPRNHGVRQFATPTPPFTDQRDSKIAEPLGDPYPQSVSKATDRRQ